MSKLDLYKEIYDKALDYADDEFILKCAKWGMNIEKNLPENKSSFICALATARIVGEFGKLAFNDYLPDEFEIDLDNIPVSFQDIKPFLDKDISKSRLASLESNNFVTINDLWSSVENFKENIYRYLFEKYKKEGQEPNDMIYESLLNLFGEVQYCMSFSREMSAYAYVSNGFNY